MNQKDMDKLIRAAFGAWKADSSQPQEHPSEELLASLAEDKLAADEAGMVKSHIVGCRRCAEAFAAQISLSDEQPQQVPDALVEKAKGLVGPAASGILAEIFLRLRDRTIEIINTSADVLVGQELVPAPVLRSRKLKDFKDEVTFLRDFQDIRVQVKIENKSGGTCSVSVSIHDKATLKAVRDLRITLIKDDTELESYLTQSGRAVFESVLLGRYTVEISSPERRAASILLEIKA